MIFNRLDRFRDQGLLILRIGIGAMFMAHGLPKLMGGPELWEKLGGALGALGIHFAPTLMGFLAAISEFGGGLLLILGLLTRPACFFLLNTMLVGLIMHIRKGDPFNVYSHAAEAAILFFSLLLIGPGKLSLDALLLKNKKGPTD